MEEDVVEEVMLVQTSEVLNISAPRVVSKRHSLSKIIAPELPGGSDNTTISSPSGFDLANSQGYSVQKAGSAKPREAAAAAAMLDKEDFREDLAQVKAEATKEGWAKVTAINRTKATVQEDQVVTSNKFAALTLYEADESDDGNDDTTQQASVKESQNCQNAIGTSSQNSSLEPPSVDNPTIRDFSPMLLCGTGNSENVSTDANNSNVPRDHDEYLHLTDTCKVLEGLAHLYSESSEDEQLRDLGRSTPARYELYKIEMKLDQLMSLIPDYGVDSLMEDESDLEDDTGSYPWALIMNRNRPSETSSCSSAVNPWSPSTSNYQTNGYTNSTSSSGESNLVSPDRSSNAQSSLHTSATKRSFGSDEGPRDYDSDDLNGRNPKQFSRFLIPGSEARLEKQIPCFVDNCPGKDKHVSEVM